MNKKRVIRRIVAVAILIIAAAAAAEFFLKQENGRDAVVRLFGNVDIREVQLSFQATGRIKRLLVDEGDRVRNGQLVGELDPVRYVHAVNRLKGEAAAQEQLLAGLLAGSRPQEIKAAGARVDAVTARLKDAEVTFNRIRELSRTEYVSRQKLDDAESTLKATRADLEAAKQALSLAVEGPRKEDIARAKETLKALKASLALAEQELKDTRLYAPNDGIIQDRILEPGAMAFPGAPVFTLALTNPLWVRAYIPEPELGRIRKGMRAEIKTDSYPDKTYGGWVGFISPTAEFTPKTVETTELRTKLVYRCRIFVCDPDRELRLGMPVTVSISLDQKTAFSAGESPCKQ